MEVELRERGDFIYYHRKDEILYWHREDGPAYINCNKTEEWFYYNRNYSRPEQMPLNLFLAYCRWEYKKNGN